MKIAIITGMSGAGKSTVARMVEDLGYFCIDNLPPSLIPKFIELCSHSQGQINKVAIIVDSRTGYLFNELMENLSYLDEMGYKYKILFLDSSDEVLVKRFKENRRVHPLGHENGILKGIEEERKILNEVKDHADHIIDTSSLNIKQLKYFIMGIFDKEDNEEKLLISIFSFGFKYRVPIDIDLVFDVRFIPNPFYIESMKKLTGKDQEVIDFVLNQDETRIFIQKLTDLLEFLIPNYVKEGKSQLSIGIGCTGGQHRSVVISEEIYNFLKEKGHKVIIDHRDIEKANKYVNNL